MEKVFRPRPGFTLIELLVVIAILAILLIMGFGSWRNQINKARDADRKSDLQRLKIAFEDFYNDRNCYPPAGILDEDFLTHCGGDDLKPYLDKIPCDPVTKQPYYLQLSDCFGYRILTTLDNDSDPVINSLNCSPNCGYNTADNYGVASGNLPVSSNPAPIPSSTPTPSASPETLYHACSPDNGGTCTYRGTTPPTNCGSNFWQDINCNETDCTNPIYQCADTD